MAPLRAHALYSRRVQQNSYRDRRNAGITDLESSGYLAFTGYFITGDRQQYRALQNLSTLNRRCTTILWYQELAHAFLVIRPTMDT